MSQDPPPSGDFICSDEIGDEFSILPDPKNFTEAKTDCAGLGATLARIASAEEYFFILATAAELGQTDSAGWVGLQAPGQRNDPSDYKFVDGSNVSTSFFAIKGAFPWADDEPNSSNKPCVDMNLDLNSNPLWFDTTCTISNKPICRRPCSDSTRSPSPAPTDSPALDDEVDLGNNVTGAGNENTVDSIQLALIGVFAFTVVVIMGMMLYVKKELSQLKGLHKKLTDLEEEKDEEEKEVVEVKEDNQVNIDEQL